MAPDDVVLEAADVFGTTAYEIWRVGRFGQGTEVVSTARHAAAWIMCEHLRMPTKEIAYALRYSDHTTVLHGVNKTRDILSVDGHYARKIRALEKRIQRRRNA